MGVHSWLPLLLPLRQGRRQRGEETDPDRAQVTWGGELGAGPACLGLRASKQPQASRPRLSQALNNSRAWAVIMKAASSLSIPPPHCGTSQMCKYF